MIEVICTDNIMCKVIARVGNNKKVRLLLEGYLCNVVFLNSCLTTNICEENL